MYNEAYIFALKPESKSKTKISPNVGEESGCSKVDMDVTRKIYQTKATISVMSCTTCVTAAN